MKEELVEAVRQAIRDGSPFDDDTHDYRPEAQIAVAGLDAWLEAKGMMVVQGWQGIESAPKGVVVWAYGTIEGDYGYTEDRKDMVKALKEPTGKWRFAQPMGRHDPISWTPDAWMPLPASPLAGGE
jgi:hypothetical protein